jgi:hypothetical protein
MKPLKKLFVILVLSTLILSVTCKKSSDNEDSNFRVIEVRNYIDASHYYLLSYHYQGDKLESSAGGFPGSTYDSAKTVFEYPDQNSMIEWGYSKTATGWIPATRIEYYIENKIVTHIEFYIYTDNPEGTPYSKIRYHYQNSKLIEEKWYSYESGNFVESSMTSYVYSGDKLIHSIYYSADNTAWIENTKQVLFYSGNEIDSIVIYEHDYDYPFYNEQNKYEYKYLDGRISRVDQFYYHKSANSWEPDGYQEYTYNENGELESETMMISSFSYTSKYYYEVGKGNFEQTTFRLSGASEKILPEPTKSFELKAESRNSWGSSRVPKIN